MITLESIQAAAGRIAGAVRVTACTHSPELSELAGCQVVCKHDYMQRTGSFKERGAANALRLLSAEERRRGVIAASAGNHALALACHGRDLGVPVTVVMPRFAPLIKAGRCERLGARVIKRGDSFEEARAHATRLAGERGLTYIHGFDDPAVIDGQGTMGLEIIEQAPDLDAVVVPVGGGGLLAGVAVAFEALRPGVRVIAVELDSMPVLSRSMEAGRLVEVGSASTLADGLAVGHLGANAFAAAAPRVDRVVSVSESEVALAILRLLEIEKAVVEGAGAAALAAVLSGKLPELAGLRVAVPLCGGNIDPMTLRRAVEYGMASDGRLAQFEVVICDRPGGLAALTSLVAREGGSIQEVHHDRIFAGPDAHAVRVRLVVETQDMAHAQRVQGVLDASRALLREMPQAVLGDSEQGGREQGVVGKEGE